MITFEHRWLPPADLMEQFISDWEELTRVAVQELGAIESRLYQTEDGRLVSIASWESESAWQHWKERLSVHPFREKYRPYKVGAPVRLSLLKTVD